MRILLVTETLTFGGAETFVLRLARRSQNFRDGSAIRIELGVIFRNQALVAIIYFGDKNESFLRQGL